MEIHRIDTIIKEAITESGNFYDSEANNARERIWSHIQLQRPNQSKPYLFRLLVAASILLLISLSALTISNIQNKKTINTLVELNRKLKNEVTLNYKNSLSLNESINAKNVNMPDTIYIEKKVIEHIPFITEQHITDTIYIQQVIYVEKEPREEMLGMNENSSPSDSIFRTSENNYKSEILISNNEPTKLEKGKKIQLKFGGNKDQINSGTLAFTANL